MRNLRHKELSIKMFTMVELLVVISIIIILISILMPALGRAKASALQIKCKNNLKNTLNVVNLYACDFNEYAPPHYEYVPTVYEYSWIQKLQSLGYLTGDTYSAYACPAYARRAESGWKAAWSTLGMDNALSKAKLSRIESSSKTIFFADAKGLSEWQNYYFRKTYHSTGKCYVHARHNNLANCGFVDGHADSVKWNKLSDYEVTCIYSLDGTEIY